MPGIDESLPFVSLKIAVLTVSDTRQFEDDKSGSTLVDRLTKAGHKLADRAIVTDDVEAIQAQVRAWIGDPDVDVIIIARGGGSVEDLLPFSNEALVRAVSACRTPVVSAIGHEQDAPLIDFVADLRASTPTDAAKRVVPSLVEQIDTIARMRSRSASVVRTLLDREQQSLDHRRSRSRMLVASRVEAAHTDIAHLAARVRALSPAATLERGYALVLAPNGSLVRDSSKVSAGDLLDIRVAQGRLQAQVTATDAG